MSIDPTVQSATQIHNQLKEALAEMRRAEESAVLLFAEILRRKVYRDLGYSSIQAYAAHALGFSESKTYQFLRLAQSLEKLPALRESLATSEISWTKARELTRVATGDNEQRWIEEARMSSRRELERKIEASRAEARSAQRRDEAQGSLLPEAQASTPVASARPALEAEAEVSVTLRLTPIEKARMEAMIEKIRMLSSGATRRAGREALILEALALRLEAMEGKRPSPQSTWAGDGAIANLGECTRVHSGGSTRNHGSSPYQIIIHECPQCGASSLETASGRRELSPASAARIACDARVLGPGKQNRSTIPPALRRAVLARDGYRCQAKGCDRRHFLEVRHLRPRSQGGGNEAANLIVLCSSCHELLHEKGLRGLNAAAIMDHRIVAHDGLDDGLRR